MKNNNVAIAFSTEHKLHFHDQNMACSYSMKSKSVLIEGKMLKVEDSKTKIEALDIIMAQYVKGKFTYNKPSVENVAIFKIEIESITGKKRGFA